MSNSLANTSVPAQPRRLTLRQQRALDAVVDSARRSPGTLAATRQGGWNYTAMYRHGKTRWRIEDAFRQPIMNGEW